MSSPSVGRAAALTGRVGGGGASSAIEKSLSVPEIESSIELPPTPISSAPTGVRWRQETEDGDGGLVGPSAPSTPSAIAISA